MTLRAKPVAARPPRPWDPRTAAASTSTSASACAILSILILAGCRLSCYNDHFGAVGSVNGQSITKDDLRNRIRSRPSGSTRRSADLTRSPPGPSATDAPAADPRQLTPAAACDLARAAGRCEAAVVARGPGRRPSPSGRRRAARREATTADQRHVWIIEIAPAADPVHGPTDEQKRTPRPGRAGAEDIKAGQSWEDVAKTVSTDASGSAGRPATSAGCRPSQRLDEAFMAALFAAQENPPTTSSRARTAPTGSAATRKIAPPTVDRAFQAKITDDGISSPTTASFAATSCTRSCTTRSSPTSRTRPAAPRLEIYLCRPRSTAAEPGRQGPPHPLCAGRRHGDASKVAADDPAWATAKALAAAAYATLQADPTQFDAIARTECDEESARSDRTGGKLPVLHQSSSHRPGVQGRDLRPGSSPARFSRP